MSDPRQPVVGAIVLAAGASTRFGSQKLLANLDGRPVLQHVLDRLAEAGVPDPIVVLPAASTTLEASMTWRGARRVVNVNAALGLSSSLQVGWAAASRDDPQPEALLLILGDQPWVSPELIRELIAAPLDPARPLLVPRYADGGGANPARIDASAASLVAEATGDRGLGPWIARHPERVRVLDVAGSNPDIDTPADLSRLGGQAAAGRPNR
ncbi:MAG TPA: nucleotidyltransferase family protein [Candidatus Limnocylindrales bacterium]